MADRKDEEKDRQIQLQTERKLLPTRMVVFIGIATILFLVFAEIDSRLLRIGVSVAGLLGQGSAIGHFVHIKTRMDKLDGGKGFFSGRSLSIFLCSVLFCLWVFALMVTIFGWDILL